MASHRGQPTASPIAVAAMGAETALPRGSVYSLQDTSYHSVKNYRLLWLMYCVGEDTVRNECTYCILSTRKAHLAGNIPRSLVKTRKWPVSGAATPERGGTPEASARTM